MCLCVQRKTSKGTNTELLDKNYLPRTKLLPKHIFSNDFFQGRKRNPNPNFLVRIFSGGVAVFHVNWWGPKSSVCSSKHREIKLLGGMSRDFAGIFEKKGLCSILVPYS